MTIRNTRDGGQLKYVKHGAIIGLNYTYHLSPAHLAETDNHDR